MPMRLTQKLQEDIKSAMRNGDVQRRSVLRYLRSEIHNEEISRQKTLVDSDIINLLGKQANQRRDSIEAFEKGGRQDLVKKEAAELAIILEYMPKQMTQEEIISLAKTVIDEVNARGPQEIGSVMGCLMPKIKGRASGKTVATLVSSLLNKSPG